MGVVLTVVRHQLQQRPVLPSQETRHRKRVTGEPTFPWGRPVGYTRSHYRTWAALVEALLHLMVWEPQTNLSEGLFNLIIHGVTFLVENTNLSNRERRNHEQET